MERNRTRGRKRKIAKREKDNKKKGWNESKT
jgi:hypothetical protein